MNRLTRRDFLRGAALAAAGVAAASCAQPTPQVIEKPITVVVEKEVPIEKEIVTTVIVEKEVPVEKEVVRTVVKEVPVEKTVVETVLVKETVEVIKEVQVTPIPPPAKYSESPMLADLVKAGQLPPVEERLPLDPMVVPIRPDVGERVGKYGGTLDSSEYRVTSGSCTESYNWSPEGLTFWDTLDKVWLPDIASSWRLSDDLTTLTISLRKGLKWSDGAPFTTDDVRFWWEDIQLNEDLTPRVGNQFAPTGEPANWVFEDDFTFRIEYLEPWVAAADNMGFSCWAPKHYLKNWHIKYNDKANDLATQEGYTEWWEAFTAHSATSLEQQDWGLPLMARYMPEEVDTSGTRYMVRNPYYWKVDPQGQQLPYTDNYIRHVLASAEVQEAKNLTGDYNLAAYGGQALDSFPMFKENEAKAGFTAQIYEGVAWGSLSWCFNYTSKDPVLREMFNDLRFRQAMSYAINRDEYNDIFHLGLAKPRQGLVPPSWSFYEEGMDQKYVEFDVDKANALLDEMGLKWDANHEWRLRLDGQPMDLYTEMQAGAFMDGFLLVSSYWKEVGLKVTIKPTDQPLYVEHLLAGDLDIGTWGGGSPNELGAHGNVPMRLVPPWHWAACCALAGLPWWEWYDSEGEIGEEPPDIIKELFQALDNWQAAPFGSAEYMKWGKRMVEINADNLWWFVVVGQTPSFIAMGNEVQNIRNPEAPGVFFDVCTPPWIPEILWIEA